MRFLKSFSIFFVLIVMSKMKLTLSYRISTNDHYSDIFINDNNREKKSLDIKINKWNFPVKYKVEDPIPEENVRKAIKILEDNTCVTFQKVDSIEPNEKGVFFKPGKACYTTIGPGFQTRPQTIFLVSICFNIIHEIIHEILHLLGLRHEHSREDRDKYITVNLDRIPEKMHKRYKILRPLTLDLSLVGYDYASLLHYSGYLTGSTRFSSPEVIMPTLSKYYLYMMGQNEKLTFNDLKQVNLVHCNQCDYIDLSTGKRKLDNYTNAECSNGGYPDFKDCSKCICPSGYTGNLCDEILPSDAECGKTEFAASQKTMHLEFEGKKICYISLTANEGKKIKLTITYWKADTTYVDCLCTNDFGHEIKFLNDKGSTGLVLCTNIVENIELTSESNNILIIYRGLYCYSNLIFDYQEVE